MAILSLSLPLSISVSLCVHVFHQRKKKNLIMIQYYYKLCQDKHIDILNIFTLYLNPTLIFFPLSICVPLAETCTQKMKEQRVILGRIPGCRPNWDLSAIVMRSCQSGLATGLHAQYGCDVQQTWWRGRDGLQIFPSYACFQTSSR